MKKLFFLFLLLPVMTFGQHSMKIGVGDGYYPKLSKSNYPFLLKGGLYFSGTTEMELYFRGVGVAIDAELTSVKTSSISATIKVANAKWEGARNYALTFSVGSLNKDGVGIATLGVGADVKLSWLISGVSEFFKDVDVQARVYLPAKMFSKAAVTNDVCAKLCVNYRLLKF